MSKAISEVCARCSKMERESLGQGKESDTRNETSPSVHWFGNKVLFCCFLNFFVVQGETFQNTSWINHFETQNIKIGGLNNELYEFKTVGRNDYPNDNDVNSQSESPASDVKEGRPLLSPPSKYRTLLTEQNSLGNVSVLTALRIRNPLWDNLGFWIPHHGFPIPGIGL